MKRFLTTFALITIPLMSLAQTTEGYNNPQEYYNAHPAPFWQLSYAMAHYMPDQEGPAVTVTHTTAQSFRSSFLAGWKIVNGMPQEVWASGTAPVFTGSFVVPAGHMAFVGWWIRSATYDPNNLPQENTFVPYTQVVARPYDVPENDK